jgi:two-component system, NarL family, sensor histidine kinase DevS
MSTDSQPPPDVESRLDALIEASAVVAGGGGLDAVLERLLDVARAVTGARYAAVGVLDDARDRIERFVTVGIGDEQRAAIGAPPVGRGILGVLISDPRPLRLADLGGDPRAVGFPDGHPPMRSFLGVPVLAGDTVFGNLYLTDKRDGEFTEEDERLVVTLAAQAGVAVRNARFFAQATERAVELERAVRELSSIHDIADATLTGDPRDRTLGLIAERARDALGCARVYVALTGDGPEAETLVVAAAAGDGGPELVGSPAPGAARLSDAIHARSPAVSGGAGRPAVVVPLAHRSQLLGAIVGEGDESDRPFDDDDRRILEAYATRAVLALVIDRVLSAERLRLEAESRLRTAELREASRRDTLRRVVEAQERERRRIARELHDETGQALTSVLLGLRLIEERDPGVAEAVADLRETITGAIHEVRALAVELRPTALDDFGLAPAIERLADSYSRRTGIAIDVHFAGLADRLPEDVETAVYRIVQEALTNVAKHAGASTASATVRRDAHRVTAVVEDDGSGFDPFSISRGLGLTSMFERAELVSGTVKIESRPGGGTTIAVEVPL